MLHDELETAIAAARLAGKTINEYYKAGFETEQKFSDDNYSEPVTIADREASRIIVETLSAAFPDDGILSEEEADDLELRLTKDRVWIIDPIDGTAGFVRHDGDFCVQIGLAEHGVPVVGVVYLPTKDLLSYAVKGMGSFLVRDGGDPQRMTTSDKRNFREMSLAISRHHPSPRIRRIIEHFGFARTVKRGSVGLKVNLVIDRSCDVYIHPGPRTKLWDTCAPQIILEEAGGRFTDMFGLDIRYDTSDLHNRNGVLATNGAAHSSALRHLEPLLREFGRVPYVPTS
jgi:3'(2'), 5'-bisphosphate nucleotidase